MKPTSIIFLIVSVVLVVLGLVTTGVAGQLAKAQDEPLFTEVSEEDGQHIDTYVYSEDNIAKIEINVNDADVNIIGGAQTPKIELINFPADMCNFSPEKRVITLNDHMDLTSFSGITTAVSNFNGLRSFVEYFKMSKLEKTVNVYVSADYPVNVINCRVDVGEVRIEKCTGYGDYNVTIGTGNFIADDVSTTSSMNVTVKNGTVTASGGEIAKLSTSVETGSVSLDVNAENIGVTISTGNLICAYPDAPESANLKLFTNVGKITIDGEQFGGYKETIAATEKYVDVSIGIGDIDITSPAGRIE